MNSLVLRSQTHPNLVKKTSITGLGSMALILNSDVSAPASGQNPGQTRPYGMVPGSSESQSRMGHGMTKAYVGQKCMVGHSHLALRSRGLALATLGSTSWGPSPYFTLDSNVKIR